MAVQSTSADPSRDRGEPPVPEAPAPDGAAQEFVTAELSASHDVDGFICSRDPEAARYLQMELPGFLHARCGSAFVLEALDDPTRIEGYYHLVGSSMRRGDAGNRHQKGLPRDAPIPVFTIAWIARDDRAERGLGKMLVADAARRAQTQYPTWGMTLFARNPELVSFYQKLGFNLIRPLQQTLNASGELPPNESYMMYAPYEAIIVE